MEFTVDKAVSRMNRGESILDFKGEITPEQINTLIFKIEEQIESLGIAERLKKKIVYILIEGLQNLFHHNDQLSQKISAMLGDRFAIVCISKTSDNYNITFGNFVNKQNKKNLTERIEKINSLNEEELKNMYKFILDHQKMSAKGGGGLGLIDIARKSGHKLSYEFMPFDEEWDFYILNVELS